MMSLGTLLVKHGWITKQQLGLAISRQREIGGRLGTCLLEMGAVTEELLNRSLAEQQGVPTAAAQDLAKIDEKVSRLLPAPIAIRYRAVPFRATNSDVDIAMLEVDNLWLQDELSFIVGRRLSVYIANEARIIEALSRYYKAPCSDRFVKLLVGLNRELRQQQEGQFHPDSRLVHSDAADALFAEAGPTGNESGDSQSDEAQGTDEIPAPAVPPAQSIPVSDEELASIGAEPVGETDSTVLPGEFYARDVTASQTVITAEAAEAALEDTYDPQEVGRILIDSLSGEFTRVMLLQATPSRVQGWMGQGPGLDEDRMAAFAIPFEQPSIFLNLRSGGSFFVGDLPDMPAHVALASCWHKDLTDEAAVFPIRVRDRLVALVYGDRGPLGLADLDLDLIRGLCAAAARAFERIIVDRKKRSRSAVSGE